ncbi:MAG: glycosyltransferase family 39 protein [Kouleothrix sp.]|nr:glycosyltransferase family 39 protein [Kouleothrix sp.]
MERALLFGTTLALIWAGQSLLRTSPLAGLAMLVAAVAAYIGLPQLVARFDGARTLGSPARPPIARPTAQPRRAAAAQPAAQQASPVADILRQRPLGARLIVASAIWGAVAYVVNSSPALQPWPALLVWASAIGLLIAGAWQLTTPRPAVSRAALLAARWEIAAVLGLTLLALALRAVRLDGIPQNFGGDEGEMGAMARAVLAGAVSDPFATGWLSHPNLWFFLQALSLQVFGNNVFGLRMLSALIGTAAVPALYAFARPLYGRPTALLATALLATYHFHIHFSRLGVNNIVDPLAALVAFTAFLHGYRTRSPLSFALAGVALGLAQHFYMGSRLAPLVIAAGLLHQLMLDRQRLWELRWHLALLGLGGLLGIGPLLGFFATHPADFNARLAMVGVFQTGWVNYQLEHGASALQILAAQARASFGAWTFEPEHSAWYDPKIPLLDQASSLLFLLGIAVTITRWRRLETALLIAWLAGVAIFGGMMMVNSPESPRYVTSAPLVCLLIAIGIAQLGALLRWLLPLGQRVVWGLSAAAVVLLALWNLNFYFREYTPRNTYGWFNTEVGTTIGRYLQQQPDPVFVYFFGAPQMYYGNASIRFQAPDVPGVDMLQPIATPDELPAAPEGRRPIFVFVNARTGELPIVQSRYPGAAADVFEASSLNGPLMTVYAPR